MTKITILGAGITGLAVASQLSRKHEITIVARNLPGDPDSQEWASPWAGAVFMGQVENTPEPWSQKIQLDAFAYMWKLAQSDPDSSVKVCDMIDLIDDCSIEKVWYRNKLPGFRVLSKEELPSDANFGMFYKSFILSPPVFLPWLRTKLEASGVRFKRASVRSLSDLKGMGHDILINCSGCGARVLKDVADEDVKLVRGQTVLVKTDYDKILIRRGTTEYTYALGRGDGTAILGGTKNWGSVDKQVHPETRADIFRRVHENIPESFPREPKDYHIIRDIVGIRPQRDGDTRIAKEAVEGQKVIHAYGPYGGGFVYSWGLARVVAEMVNESDFELPKARL